MEWRVMRFGAAALICAACGWGCKSPEAEQSVFIPEEYAKLMKESAGESGMRKVWGRPDLIRKYDKIKVGVVISPRQLEESEWQGMNVRNMVSSKDDDMTYVAEYARESFVRAFKDNKQIKLTDKPGPDTLGLDFAIVQVVPNKPILGAISNLSSLTPIGLIIIPLKMGAKGASSDSGGAIAMESVLRDSVNGKILAVFADREKGKTAIFNAKEFTAYSNIRAIIDAWTKNIATALDQIKAGEKVHIDPSNAFTPIDF